MALCCFFFLHKLEKGSLEMRWPEAKLLSKAWRDCACFGKKLNATNIQRDKVDGTAPNADDTYKRITEGLECA